MSGRASADQCRTHRHQSAHSGRRRARHQSLDRPDPQCRRPGRQGLAHLSGDQRCDPLRDPRDRGVVPMNRRAFTLAELLVGFGSLRNGLGGALSSVGEHPADIPVAEPTNGPPGKYSRRRRGPPRRVARSSTPGTGTSSRWAPTPFECARGGSFPSSVIRQPWGARRAGCGSPCGMP